MRFIASGLLNLTYLLLLMVASPLLIWQHWTGKKKRTGWTDRLWGPRFPFTELSTSQSSGSDPLVWIHAVSVGEVNLALNLLSPLQERFPRVRWALSSTTDSGLTLARKRADQSTTVFRFPLDFSWAVARVFQQLRPSLLILTELEVWPNLLRTAAFRSTPVVIINARLSEKSFRNYRRMGFLVGRWFRSLSLVLAQNETYAQRFIALGVPADRVSVSGSIKFDSAQTDRHNEGTRRLAEQFCLGGQRPIWLAGSTSEPEERRCLEIYHRLRAAGTDLQLILVPRHPERFSEVAEACRELADRGAYRWGQRSQVQGAQTFGDWDILLVDTIGELSSWWGCADVGFVGGSFGTRGGQSMIEPAAYGVATCFGPRTSNFRDVVAMLEQAQAARTVPDAEGLQQFVQQMVADPIQRNQLGQRARQLVQEQAGATEITLQALEPWMGQTSPTALPTTESRPAHSRRA